MSKPLEIYFYSQESFIVTGSTKHVKDDLKALGGKFTCNLRNFSGASWLFSMKRLKCVKLYLTTGKITKEELVYTPPVCMLRKWNPEDDEVIEEAD